MSARIIKGRLILNQMNDEDRAAVIEAILNVPIDEHFDRMARLNARTVLAQGEGFYGEKGYRNPKLLDGCNIVRAYLTGLAMDNGVTLENPA